MMHERDASERGLSPGDVVEVRSRVGIAHAPLEVSDRVMPGVVSLPHGFGHDRAGTRLQVAQAMPGASINDLTDPLFLDTLTGNAVLNGVPVTVARARPL